MLEKPRSFEHKIFLRKQLKQLQNGKAENNSGGNYMDSYPFSHGKYHYKICKDIKEKLERIKAKNRL
jgi:hypothetical protein